MKLLQLDVEGFKCVQRARVRFGPGLNVMYGPNDIGKSSLAEALRAVLLLPSTSSERRSFEPFGGGEPPHVRLLFTFRERFWRVDKRWGDGARGNAMLEVSGDGEVWSKHESQRAVDAELRKMLAWGVREPGGKGAPKGLPSSFITTALLGGAAPVDELFAADLGKDSDPAGRERLTEALQSFAEDPLFKRMLGQAQGMVDRAKDSRGNWRRGRDAPLFHIGERIRELQQELASLVRAAEHAEAVEQAAASHRERRAALLLEHEAQRASVERLRARCEAGAHAREVLAAREQAHAQLEACEQLHARAQALREQVAAAANDANTCATQVQQAEAEVERTRAAQQSAASALQRRGDREAAAHERTAALELRVAAASTACERIEAQRARVVEARTLADESARAGAEAADARAHARAAEQRASQAEAALRPAHEAVIACESALARARWREAQAEAERLHAAAGEAASLQQQAQQRRLAHDARVRELDAAALPDDAALARVRELETRLRRARDQAAVGFAVTLQLAAPAGLSLDDAPARATASGSHAAQRRMQIDLGAAGSLAIEAGSAALREEVAAAEAAWARDGAPVLQRLALADVDALADRIAQAKQTRIELLAEAHACDALVREAQRLQPPPELLAQAQARVQALAAVVPADEDLAATASIEVLERQREVLERDRAALREQLQQAQSARTLAQAHAEHARTRADGVAARAEHAREQLASTGARARDLGLVLAEIDDELAAARVELESVQRERAAALGQHEREHASLQQAADAAALALAEAVAREGAARLELTAARERVAATQARLDEAHARAQASDREALQTELARAQAAVAALGDAAQLQTLDADEQALVLARAQLDALGVQLAEVTAELQKAEGSLEQLGGAGLRERAQDTQAALVVATDRERDGQRDVEAWQLLRDTLRAVEAEQGQHLGNALAGAVETRLRRLTGGGYARLELDRDLRPEGLRIAGAPRALDVLSAGLREQLATLVRLAIAEHLQQVLVLDDHLSQTDPRRVDYFRDLLREVAQRVQIVVLTCRPLDYLQPRELPAEGEQWRGSDDGLVRAIDLGRVIARAPVG